MFLWLPKVLTEFLGSLGRQLQSKLIVLRKTWRKFVGTTNASFRKFPNMRSPAGSSRAQMSYSIMHYVFLADSVPRELPDKIGGLDKLCDGIMHVHWVMISMWLSNTSSSFLTSPQFQCKFWSALMMCACCQSLLFLSIWIHITVEEGKICSTCSVWLRLLLKI